jgi:hypothetical protein
LSQATEVVAEAWERRREGATAGEAAADRRLTALMTANPDQKISVESIRSQLLARENA